MAKEQISIRLEPETLQKLDALAAIEQRTRNNMLEVLIFEGLTSRISGLSDTLFERLELLSDRNLTGPELKLAGKQSRVVTEAVKKKVDAYARLLPKKKGK
jgi:predicted DNA-binding protein